MELVACNFKLSLVPPITSYYPTNPNKKNCIFNRFSNCPFHFCNSTTSSRTYSSIAITNAKKKKTQIESESPIIDLSIIEEVYEDVDDDDELDDVIEEYDDDDDDLLITDEFLDEDILDDDEFFEEEYEDAEVFAGDGADGGGISLAGTWWDKEALAIAESVTESFDGDLGIYAFRTLVNATIQVRIEKLSTKSSSPSMKDIEAFSTAYRARLDEAELAKTIPENISLEVSSPGVERVVCIPQDFDRFKERPMYVKYNTEVDGGSPRENDGVFKLVSFDLETNCCTWGIADVRINREKAGKGRPLSKKQREWRLTTPFDSIRLVRLYSEF